MHREKIHRLPVLLLLPCEPVGAVVYQRCGLNLAMVTPWKKQGEAGILVWRALFLATEAGTEIHCGLHSGLKQYGVA